MGRAVRRVPVDFDHPIGEQWPGYLPPDQRPCPECKAGFTPAGEWLKGVVFLLMMLGEDPITRADANLSSRARAMHPWLVNLPLRPAGRPGPDMTELTTGLAGRAPSLFGHDECDNRSAYRKIVGAAGLNPEEWGTCPACDGHAVQPDDLHLEDGWEPTDPPEGEGWQLWETVSEGSPISPVFESSSGLVDWLCSPDYTWGGPLERADAEALVGSGWMPSMIMVGGTITVDIGGAGLAEFKEHINEEEAE